MRTTAAPVAVVRMRVPVANDMPATPDLSPVGALTNTFPETLLSVAADDTAITSEKLSKPAARIRKVRISPHLNELLR
jgi:hypothetical protein